MLLQPANEGLSGRSGHGDDVKVWMLSCVSFFGRRDSETDGKGGATPDQQRRSDSQIPALPSHLRSISSDEIAEAFPISFRRANDSPSGAVHVAIPVLDMPKGAVACYSFAVTRAMAMLCPTSSPAAVLCSMHLAISSSLCAACTSQGRDRAQMLHLQC